MLTFHYYNNSGNKSKVTKGPKARWLHRYFPVWVRQGHPEVQQHRRPAKYAADIQTAPCSSFAWAPVTPKTTANGLSLDPAQIQLALSCEFEEPTKIGNQN